MNLKGDHSVQFVFFLQLDSDACIPVTGIEYVSQQVAVQSRDYSKARADKDIEGVCDTDDNAGP